MCVSNIGCRKKNEVRLYDSLYRGILPFTKEQIAALLFIQDSDQIEVSIPPVDQQTNGTDCGVFAIAFATALCYKLDPTSLKFNRRAIRAHLWNSLQNWYVGIFPFDENSWKWLGKGSYHPGVLRLPPPTQPQQRSNGRMCMLQQMVPSNLPKNC